MLRGMESIWEKFVKSKEIPKEELDKERELMEKNDRFRNYTDQFFGWYGARLFSTFFENEELVNSIIVNDKNLVT